MTKNEQQKISPKHIGQMKVLAEMPMRHQAILFLISVWASYIAPNEVRAWRVFWKKFRRLGGFG